MSIQGSTPEGRRWLRRRGRLVLAGVVAAFAIAAVPVAWATFNDVPPSNPFYADINAIQGAGITGGCGGGNFCPTANIQRQAEAAFLHRGLPRIGATHLAGIASGAVDVVLGSVPFSLSGEAGGHQGILVRVDMQADVDGAVAADCFPNIALRRGGVILDQWDFELYPATTPIEAPVGATFVTSQNTGTTATYQLIADNPCSQNIFTDEDMMTVQSIPFNGAGGAAVASTGTADSHDG